MARGFGSSVGVSTTDVIETASIADDNLISIAMFARRNADGGGGYPFYLSKTSGGEGLQIYDAVSTSKLMFQWDWTSYGRWSCPRPSVADWHSLIFTYDGGSIANDPIIYVDGVSQTVTELNTPSGSRSSNTVPFRLGQYSDTTYWFNGWLAETYIWTGILLSAAESAAISRGVRPHRIRRDALKVGLPIFGVHSPEIDLVGATATVTGTSLANGPPVTLFTPKIAAWGEAAGTVVTPSALAASAAVVDPTVVLGGIAIAPAVIAAAAANVDPTVLNALSVSPSAIEANGALVDPAIVLGGVAVSPAVLAASAGIVNPEVVLGGIAVTPGAAIAALVTINPSVTGNIVITPLSLDAMAFVLDPTVLWAFIPSGPWVVQTAVVGKTLATIVQRLELQTAVLRVENGHIVTRDENSTTVH